MDILLHRMHHMKEAQKQRVRKITGLNRFPLYSAHFPFLHKFQRKGHEARPTKSFNRLSWFVHLCYFPPSHSIDFQESCLWWIIGSPDEKFSSRILCLASHIDIKGNFTGTSHRASSQFDSWGIINFPYRYYPLSKSFITGAIYSQVHRYTSQMQQRSPSN